MNAPECRTGGLHPSSTALESLRWVLNRELISKHLHCRKSAMVADMVDRLEWSLEHQGSRICTRTGVLSRHPASF